MIRRLSPFVGPSLLITLYISDKIHIVQVNGISMVPTINHGDILLGYCTSAINNGDVVLIESPQCDRQVKRVISSTYVVPDKHSPYHTSNTAIKIPKETAWVEGDYNSCSKDSNSYGPIHNSCIKGKLLFNVSQFNFIQAQVSERYNYRLKMFTIDKFIKTNWWDFIAPY